MGRLSEYVYAAFHLKCLIAKVGADERLIFFFIGLGELAHCARMSCTIYRNEGGGL